MPAIVLIVLVTPPSPWLALPIVALLAAAWLLSVLLQVTLSGIYAAALYRFAANGAHSDGVDEAALHTAFLPKK